MTTLVSGIAGEDIADGEVVVVGADGRLYAKPSEPESDEGAGELIIKASEYCALCNRIKELEALVDKMKCCGNCAYSYDGRSCPLFCVRSFTGKKDRWEAK